MSFATSRASSHERAPDSVAVRRPGGHAIFVTSDMHPRTFVWIAAGVAAGALLRWAIDATVPELWTLGLVNAGGCAVMGLIFERGTERTARLVGTGFCGGLTTMSSAAVAVGEALADSRWVVAVATMLMLTVVSVAGFALGRRLAVAT